MFTTLFIIHSITNPLCYQTPIATITHSKTMYIWSDTIPHALRTITVPISLSTQIHTAAEPLPTRLTYTHVTFLLPLSLSLPSYSPFVYTRACARVLCIAHCEKEPLQRFFLGNGDCAGRVRLIYGADPVRAKFRPKKSAAHALFHSRARLSCACVASRYTRSFGLIYRLGDAGDDGSLV